jgi:hypothetical protein
MSDEEYYNEDQEFVNEGEEFANEGEDNESQEYDYGEDQDFGQEIEDQEQKIMPTFKDTQRVAKTGKTTIGKGKIADIDKELEKRGRKDNPKLYFKDLIEVIIKRISNYEGDDYSYNELKKYLNKFANLDNIYRGIDYVDNIQYKNPAGFVFGFLSTNGGKEISKKNMKFILKNIEDIIEEDTGEIKESLVYKEFSIKPPAVIRYAKLWLDIYQKMSKE